jgi:hypothetical protein
MIYLNPNNCDKFTGGYNQIFWFVFPLMIYIFIGGIIEKRYTSTKKKQNDKQILLSAPVPLGVGLLGMGTNSVVEFHKQKDLMNFHIWRNNRPSVRQANIERSHLSRDITISVHEQAKNECEMALQICRDNYQELIQRFNETGNFEINIKEEVIGRLEEYLIEVHKKHFSNHDANLKLLSRKDEFKFTSILNDIDNIKNFLNYIIPLPEAEIISENTGDKYYELLFYMNPLKINCEGAYDVKFNLPLSTNKTNEVWEQVKDFATSIHCFLVKWAGAQSQNEDRFRWSYREVSCIDQWYVFKFLLENKSITKLKNYYFTDTSNLLIFFNSTSASEKCSFHQIYHWWRESLILVSNWGTFIHPSCTNNPMLQRNGISNWYNSKKPSTYNWRLDIYIKRLVDTTPQKTQVKIRVDNLFLNNQEVINIPNSLYAILFKKEPPTTPIYHIHIPPIPQIGNAFSNNLYLYPYIGKAVYGCPYGFYKTSVFAAFYGDVVVRKYRCPHGLSCPHNEAARDEIDFSMLQEISYLENAFPIWGLFPAISFILQFFFPKLLVKIDRHFQFILNYIKFQFFIGLNLAQDY